MPAGHALSSVIGKAAFLLIGDLANRLMSKKTLNQTNLETLGAERLAQLLMEVSTGSADIKRRLRLELSHNLGVDDLAHEVRKRLASLRKSKSYVGWRKRKALIKDLDVQRVMIVDKISPEDPTLGFELLWLFIELATPILARVDDSKGDVAQVFRLAFDALKPLSERAVVDQDALADQVWSVLRGPEADLWNGVIAQVSPALGAQGLQRLEQEIRAFEAADTSPSAQVQDHAAMQFLRQLRGAESGPVQRKARLVQKHLQDIATLRGDTAGYIALFTPQDLERAEIAAKVASLLLKEGQAQEAYDVLQRIESFESEAARDAWDIAYIESLTALGQPEAARTHRWDCFLESLNADHLRAYLKELPDFEDVEAEDRAKAYVLSQVDFARALRFFLEWADLLSAAELIEARSREIDGEQTFLLAPAAETLRVRYPRAALLLLRAMIEFTLDAARTSRYGEALLQIADCAEIASEITDFKDLPPHEDYIERLKHRHARKSGFWASYDAQT